MYYVSARYDPKCDLWKRGVLKEQYCGLQMVLSPLTNIEPLNTLPTVVVFESSLYKLLIYFKPAVTAIDVFGALPLPRSILRENYLCEHMPSCRPLRMCCLRFPIRGLKRPVASRDPEFHRPLSDWADYCRSYYLGWGFLENGWF